MASLLFRCLAVASIPLLVATTWLWHRSHARTDQLYVHYDPLLKRYEGLFIQSASGHITVTSMNTVPTRLSYPRPNVSHFATGPAWYDEVYLRMPHRALGFGYGPVIGNVGFAVPHYAVVLLCLAFPAAWAARQLNARRIRPAGQCRRCGYDLRATSHRCPECGLVSTPENVG